MSADDDIDISFFEIVQYVFSHLALHTAGQEYYFQSHAFEQRIDTLKMLLRQYLSGCHQACLEAIVYAHEHSEEGYHRLTATYITLEQPIHLFA